MNKMLAYFFRSAIAGFGFVFSHIMLLGCLVSVLWLFNVSDPWCWFYLQLILFAITMYWVLSNKHRLKILRLADPVSYRYPDVAYGGPDGTTPTWPGGNPIHDLLTWIAAARQVPRTTILRDWYKNPDVKVYNEKEHAAYLARYTK